MMWSRLRKMPSINSFWSGVTSRQAEKLLPLLLRLAATSTSSSAPSLPIQAWLRLSMTRTS